MKSAWSRSIFSTEYCLRGVPIIVGIWGKELVWTFAISLRYKKSRSSDSFVDSRISADENRYHIYSKHWVEGRLEEVGTRQQVDHAKCSKTWKLNPKPRKLNLAVFAADRWLLEQEPIRRVSLVSLGSLWHGSLFILLAMSPQEKNIFMRQKSARERSEALYQKGSLKAHTARFSWFRANLSDLWLG